MIFLFIFFLSYEFVFIVVQNIYSIINFTKISKFYIVDVFKKSIFRNSQ